MTEELNAMAPYEHPESTLRGRMIRELWDASPFFRYADAVKGVDAILSMPEFKSFEYNDHEPLE